MCHFHSVIVTGDGRILHDESNSHSTIASKHNLGADLDAKWWECEWDGRGAMPVNLVQSRGKDTAPTAAAERAAQRHYEKLAAIVSGDLDPADTFPFDGPDYRDVRKVYGQSVCLKQLEPIIALLEDVDFQEDAIRHIIEQLSLDVDEIAKERIQELEDEKEQAYSNGIEAASEDMVSWDYHQELLEEEKQKWLDELEEEKQEKIDEVAYSEYCLGVVDAKAGAVLQVDFINDMPSFLFE